MGPDVFARTWADLVAPPVVVTGADVNELSADEKRALIKAEMARVRAQRGAIRGG